MRTQDLWAALSAQPFPYLYELTPVERNGFVLLDAYLRDCLDEWCTSGGQLSSRAIVLLDGCSRSITRSRKRLDGEGQYYFGQFQRLARRILRGVDVEQAYQQTEQEVNTELDWEHTFDCCPGGSPAKQASEPEEMGGAVCHITSGRC